MQPRARRVSTTLIAICLFSAALTAPPSVFAATTLPTAPTSPIIQSPATAVPAPPSDHPVRIGIGRSAPAAVVTAAGGLTVVAGGVVQGLLPAGQSAQVTLTSGTIQVAGVATAFPGPVRLVPTPSPTPNYISYGTRNYRGEIEILVSPKDQKLSVVNVVNLEEYLQGVVPREMTYTWPLEALKAQAVAARTYSLTHIGQYKDEGFDMVPTTDNQDYGGMLAEMPQTNQAVAGTKGRVLTFGGKLAGTYYFSSSGGYTENKEVVWGGIPVVYLQAVQDYDKLDDNKWYAWRFNFPLDVFTQKLKSASYDAGAVTAVIPFGTISTSGRPIQWQVTGASSTVIIKAPNLRTALGLPGLVRSVMVKLAGYIHSNRTLASGDAVYVVGADRILRQRPMRENFLVGYDRTPGLSPALAAVVGPPIWQESGVEVAGGGNGHAVGLSQWGAYGMARLGKTYDQILTYFYQGTKVAPIT